eukprot:364876-Chlamydomonas_euryale.AAC.9
MDCPRGNSPESHRCRVLQPHKGDSGRPNPGGGRGCMGLPSFNKINAPQPRVARKKPIKEGPSARIAAPGKRMAAIRTHARTSVASSRCASPPPAVAMSFDLSDSRRLRSFHTSASTSLPYHAPTPVGRECMGRVGQRVLEVWGGVTRVWRGGGWLMRVWEEQGGLTKVWGR